jgi:hypothetical protein
LVAFQPRLNPVLYLHHFNGRSAADYLEFCGKMTAQII